MAKLLITGITGSFGSEFLRLVLKNTTWDVVGISRNESRQEELAATLSHGDKIRVELVPCDVTHPTSLAPVLVNVDKVVHAAALKRVANSAKYPSEYARVNVGGTQSLLAAAGEEGARVVFISSDKAVMAHNLYGATKRVGEALTLAYSRGMVVRGGNVWDSSGSVVRVWNQDLVNGRPPIVYDRDATRFHMHMDDWCVFVLNALMYHVPGTVLTPKLKSYRLGDLSNAFFEVHGVMTMDGRPRPEDKQHEYIISPIEAPAAVEIEWGYVLGDAANTLHALGNVIVGPVPEHGIDSDNAERLTDEELFKLVTKAGPVYETVADGL